MCAQYLNIRSQFDNICTKCANKCIVNNLYQYDDCIDANFFRSLKSLNVRFLITAKNLYVIHSKKVKIAALLTIHGLF